MAAVRQQLIKARRIHRRTLCSRVLRLTRPRSVSKGHCKISPVKVGQRGPYLSHTHPTNGPRKDVNVKGRKMKPPPSDSQPNVACVCRGKTVSRPLKIPASTSVPNSADKSRRDERRAITGGNGCQKRGCEGAVRHLDDDTVDLASNKLSFSSCPLY